ncbi:hypothetical protein REPUB_Repub17cG0186600 [Reevesia pubescens]
MVLESTGKSRFKYFQYEEDRDSASRRPKSSPNNCHTRSRRDIPNRDQSSWWPWGMAREEQLDILQAELFMHLNHQLSMLS